MKYKQTKQIIPLKFHSIKMQTAKFQIKRYKRFLFLFQNLKKKNSSKFSFTEILKRDNQ